MINRLKDIEKILPELLQQNNWNSVFVNYHKPYVNRLWKQIDEYRLCLHMIEPCLSEEALFHPHPWPSAMKIISGTYEMGYGYSEKPEKPNITSSFILTSGSYYQMLTDKDWHYVRPLERSSLSMMLSGKPFLEKPATNPDLKPLNEKKRQEIMNLFRDYYP